MFLAYTRYERGISLHAADTRTITRRNLVNSVEVGSAVESNSQLECFVEERRERVALGLG